MTVISLCCYFGISDDKHAGLRLVPGLQDFKQTHLRETRFVVFKKYFEVATRERYSVINLIKVDIRILLTFTAQLCLSWIPA